jgi:hypothetical protein
MTELDLARAQTIFFLFRVFKWEAISGTPRRP